jgi:hypothetical protein
MPPDGGGDAGGAAARADESKFAPPSFALQSGMELTGPATMEGNRLKIYIPENANDWGNSMEFVPEATDFTITARLNFKPTKQALQAGIMLYNPSAGQYNAIKLTRGYFTDFSQFQLAECAAVEGLLVGGRGVTDNIASSTAWLRLIKNGRNVGGYYSADGENFSYVSIGRTNMTVEKVLLFGSSWKDKASATVYFDEFTIDYENHTIETP